MAYRIATVAAAVGLALLLPPRACAQASSTGTAPGAAEPNAGASPPIDVVASPWTRYCAKSPAASGGGAHVCFTASDGHLASGQKLVIALLIEPQAGGAKRLRVTLPLGVALAPGARVVVDGEGPMTAPFLVCLPRNGCMADFAADAGLIDRLKAGRTLEVQAFEKDKPIRFTLPLAGFAKAYEGPASEPPT